jgi:hypothetical protein
MDKLPTEILHTIFIHLPIIQKQESMLVCRHWKEVISARSLFHTIDCSCTKVFHNLIEMINKSPSISSQVQNLKLYGSFEGGDNLPLLDSLSPLLSSDSIINQTLQIFLNLREIEFKPFRPKPLEDHSFIETSDLIPMPSRIESICEYGTAIMTCSLAKFGLCSHLVSLKLHLISFYSRTDPGVLCSLLKNMPVLENLELWSQFITPNHCETVHSNIQSLKCLSLRCIEHGGDDTNFGNIQPSPSITKLYLQVSIVEPIDISKWFCYIDEKYPNLQHFHFGNSRPVYRHGPEVLRQHWNSQLTSLDLAFGHFDSSLFHILDKSGCKVKNLKLAGGTFEIVDALIRSNQCYYIKVLDIDMKYVFSHAWLEKLKKLEALSLKTDSLDIAKASDIFQCCPDTVESVDIRGYQVEIDSEVTNQRFPIKELSIDHAKKDSQMVAFIENCFPYLKSLSIRKVLDGSEIYQFPNHHFSKLDIGFHGLFGFNLSVTTLNDNITRYYNISNRLQWMGRQKYENYISSVPKENITDGTHIKLICGSANDVIFGGLYLSLIKQNIPLSY